MALNKLDSNQVIKSVYVEAEEALRVSGNFSVTGGASSVKQDQQTLILQEIDNNTDTLEPLITNSNTKLDSILLDTNSLVAKTAAGIVPNQHDYILTTYVGATTRISTVTYKLGGASGTTVATLTLAYDGSDRLTSVTRS